MKQKLEDKSLQVINEIPDYKDYRNKAFKKLALAVEDDRDLFLKITFLITNVNMCSKLLNNFFYKLISIGELELALSTTEGLTNELLKTKSYEFISITLAEANDLIKAEDIAEKIQDKFSKERAYEIIIKAYFSQNKIDKVMEHWHKISPFKQLNIIEELQINSLKDVEYRLQLNY